MRFESPDVVAQNVDRLGALFPTCVTETAGPDGKLRKSVNFDALRRLLDRAAVDDSREAYEFTWVGKKAALREANAPIRKTLRPCPEESKNWETTENLYIEGDNLDVLKLLQANYLAKVKMIYIDPPYNTGNDFIYRDDFSHSQEEEDALLGRLDEDDNRLFKNTETNSRFHSDWCSMIYSRLLLARNLLRDDGVIFISIDDNECANLQKIANEIFGESNFVAIINWRARGGRQDSKFYAAVHEYIFIYAKNIGSFHAGEEIKENDQYPKFDLVKNRYYKTCLLRKWGSNSRREDRPNLYYPIKAPDGSDLYPLIHNKKKNASESPDCGRWRHGPSTMAKNIAEGRVEFVQQADGSWVAYEKIFAPLEGEEATKKYTTWIEDKNDGGNFLKTLFGSAVFDYPKSPALINRFLKMADIETGDVVLDFFSGSSSTAHAVMQFNMEESERGKFIMVQIPELCAEKTEAYKAGYKTICEIGKERIRRAGEKIKSENPLTTRDLDVGFRVLKVDDSNMKNVYYHPDDLSQQNLLDSVENIKEDRSDLDLLFGCVLDWGLELSRPYTSEKVGSYTIHNYDDGKLVACFDENVSEELVRMIAKTRPERVVFRDSSFKSAPEKINLFEIFKFYMPESADEIYRRVRVI